MKNNTSTVVAPKSKSKVNPAKSKSKSNVKVEVKVKSSRGRPAIQPKIPTSLKWTMRDFCRVNGVDYFTGKGEKCGKLTLINFKGKNTIGDKSLIVELDEVRQPDSETGIGAKQIVYALRANLKAIEEHDAKSKAPKSKATKSKATKDYDAIKTELLADTSMPIQTSVESTDNAEESTDFIQFISKSPVA